MIAHVPIVILLPGILFIAVGGYYLRQPRGPLDGADLNRRLRLARRQTGIVTLGFGILLLAVGIPLILAVMQLES